MCLSVIYIDLQVPLREDSICAIFMDNQKAFWSDFEKKWTNGHEWMKIDKKSKII